MLSGLYFVWDTEESTLFSTVPDMYSMTKAKVTVLAIEVDGGKVYV
jgi:hypothetical protein